MARTPARIVRVVTRLSVGGPAQHVCLLTKSLDRGNFRSWLVAGRSESNEKEDLELPRRLGVEPIFVPGLCRSVGPWDVKASLALGRVLRDLRADVVHTHTAKAGALGRLMVLKSSLHRGYHRPRLVHTFHGHVFHGYFRPASAATFVAIERFLARFTDMIVTVSAEVRKELVDTYRIAPPYKVRVVPLGLDFAWIERIPQSKGWLREKFSVDEKVPIIGLIGRLAKIKNNELAIRAFARFNKVTGIDARLAIFGDGELKPEMESLVDRCGIGDKVAFLGWELDKARLFSDLNITCLSSLNEGTPVVLIESLAAGVPVTATSVGGVKDVVEHNRDGFLVESGNELAFANALESMLRHPFRLEPARISRIRARYSLARLVADIRDLYDELLGINRKPSNESDPGHASQIYPASNTVS